MGLASLLAEAGDPADALQAFRECVRRAHRMQVWHHQWTTLRNLARLLTRIGAREPAAVLLGAIGAAATASPAFGADADRLASTAQVLGAALGAPALASATARGAAMTGDAAVVFALAAIEDALASPQALRSAAGGG